MAKKVTKAAQAAKGKAKTMAPKTAASARPIAKDTSKAIAVFLDPKALAPKGKGEEIAKVMLSSEAELSELESKVNIVRTKKNNALSEMTQLFYVAAQADKSINLAILNKQDATNKEKEPTFKKLRAVLGIINVTINADGTETVTQPEWANELFPKVGETLKNSNDLTIQARETNRANFTARIRDAGKAAYGAISNGITAEIDKATGKLAISGKAVREHFEHDRVILDERQNFEIDGKKVNLKVKPSITELGRMGGAVVRRREPGPVVNVANLEQVAERIASWQTTLEKLITAKVKLDDKVLSALDNLADTIDKVRDTNEAIDE